MQHTGKINIDERVISRSQSSPEVTTFSGFKNFLAERRSFTGALEGLHLSNKMMTGEPETIEKPIGPNITAEIKCPCACYLKPASNVNIRTREKGSMQLYVVGSEILNYQGHTYSTDDIAPLWKKDCRTWLWKSSKIKQCSSHIDISGIEMETTVDI